MLVKLIKSARRLSNILISVFLLAACGQNPHQVAVTDKQPPPSEKLTHHIVAKGETLYSIAWRYNIDFKKLAAANGISGRYHIYPGQRILLSGSVTAPKSTSVKTTKSVKASPKKQSKPQTRSKKATQKSTTAIKSTPGKDPLTWVWPARGKLIAGFRANAGLNKGIDLQGKLGEPVLAAASGRVVYSGEGLRGYGKLVIVKHSEKYLSAYAHNRSVFVNEGSYVKQGQKIAEMGSTGTDIVKLHFEIRYDGKPVDPLRLLPKH
ncbi:MAG: peptidoglycan DD-metalloendopeptidase family protein [Agarilytica sp.]